ncbi:MAG: hypothetical protein GY797_14340 [Deltaproteobacteria bacterium]|nr:hypothetical protein [Deltaproteobacteria bacterium]
MKQFFLKVLVTIPFIFLAYTIIVWILYRCSIVEELLFHKAAGYFFLSASLLLFMIGIVATYYEFQEGRVGEGIGIPFIAVGGYTLFHLFKGDFFN